MKVCSASLRRVVASGLILTFTILPLPSAMAQGNASSASITEDGLPLSPIERAQQDGTAIPLSLTEFTRMVLQNNLDVAISDTNAQDRLWSLHSAYGTYDRSLSFNSSYNSNRSVSTSQWELGSGSSSTTSDTFNYGLTFSQPLKSGGSISVTHSPGRTSNSSSTATFNPSYSGSLQVSYNQDLWRNLRVDNARNQIKIANLNIELNENTFKQTVTRVIGDAQRNYWDLVSSIRNYDIQRNAVRLAQRNLNDQKRRLEVGTIPPIDVTTAEASVSSRELNLISAEDSILQAQNNLRQMISSDRNSDIWRKVIVPTDSPDFREYKIDADTALAIALQNRPELEQSRINLATLELQNQLQRENLKWRVRLNSSFNLSGTAGQVRPEFAGRYKDNMIGGLGTYYKLLFSDPNTRWSVSINIDVPLKNRQLEATLAQQEISKRRYLMQRQQTEQSIQVEVRNALQTLESSRRQIDAAVIARKLAEEQLDGEIKRNEAGLSQNYRVLDVQQALSQQEYSELQALIRYKQAIISLQRTMYNLLEDSDFSIARGSSVNIPNFKYPS